MLNNMKKKRQVFPRSIIYVIIFASILLLLISCEEKIEKPGSTDLAENVTCVDCHTDAEALQALATPEPPPSGGGGG